MELVALPIFQYRLNMDLQTPVLFSAIFTNTPAQIGGKKIGVFWFLSCFFGVWIGVYGVWIIPKWLIKVPGHIPILFGWILELPKFSFFWTRSGSSLPVFIMEILQKIQEKYGNHFRNLLSFHISTFWNSKCLTFLGPINPHNFCIIF